MLMTGLTAMAVTARPASAAHLSCGSMVMASTKLAADIGPCAGDGLLLMGSNINLNLNGKRVFAANGPGDNAGIRVVAGMTGVAPTGNIVRNGIVDGFDGGVVIVGGSRNTVTRITAQNNINDLQSVGEPFPGVCELGEGIAILNSSDNMITSNSVINNGPFGGISVIENSDRNQIRTNRVRNNNIQGLPAIPGGRAGCGNTNQDEGIRIEGPGANDNVVQENIVEKSLLAGIGLHGHICGDPAANTPANTGTIVRGNFVSGTVNPGATVPPGPASANGISFLRQGPAGIVCPAFNTTVTGNISQSNAGNGIFVATNSANNTISGNRVARNGLSGILVEGPIFGNVFTNVGPTLFDVVTPDRAPFVLSPAPPAPSADFQVQSGSGSGDVTGRLVAIDIRFTAVGGLNTNPADTSTSGCEQADYTAAGFVAGNVALIQRGTCTFEAKIALAVANGASAVVLFNEGQTGRTTPAFGGVAPRTIPLLTTSFAVGVELTNLARAGAVTVRVTTNTTNVQSVRAPGAGGNTLNANIGRNNVRFDGEDLNLNCGTNNWSNNDFLTVNQHCVDPDSMVPPPALPAGAGPLTGSSDEVDGPSRRSVSSTNS